VLLSFRMQNKNIYRVYYEKSLVLYSILHLGEWSMRSSKPWVAL
jgi:hypothetical protein